MKLSLSNGIFSNQSLEENFRSVVELGFENIEFNMKSVKKEHDTDVYREKRLREETNLNCLTLHSATLHMEDPIEVYRAVYYGKDFAGMRQSTACADYDCSFKHRQNLQRGCTESSVLKAFSGK